MLLFPEPTSILAWAESIEHAIACFRSRAALARFPPTCKEADQCATTPKQLGIPTANIPPECLSAGGHDKLDSGVYFGWAGLDVDAATHGSGSADDSSNAGRGMTYPMVMSIGWNPYYKNEVRSVVRA